MTNTKIYSVLLLGASIKLKQRLRSKMESTPHDRTVCVQASFSVKITATRGATHCRYTVFLEILDFYAMKIEVKEVKKSIF